jgi:L-rhamnose mutarotase
MPIRAPIDHTQPSRHRPEGANQLSPTRKRPAIRQQPPFAAWADRTLSCAYNDFWSSHAPSAFRLRIKPDAIAGYEEDHQNVWPELLAQLKGVGISDYSIFRRDQDLVLVMRVKNFDAAWDALANDPVNLRWQAEMPTYFEPCLASNPVSASL